MAVALCAMALPWGWPLAAPPRPDLVVDPNMLVDTYTVGLRYFEPGHCALVEGCVDGPGLRKLLAFTTQTGNISRTDLQLGDPDGNPLFEFSPCHGHFHLSSYADYSLRDLQGGLAAAGHKQSFCLLDVVQYVFESWVLDPPAVQYDCDFQGISAGWSDIYDNSTDCQWIDVTGVPAGDYALNVEVNPARIIREQDHANNLATATVAIPDLSAPPDLVVDGARIADTWRMDKKLVVPGDPGLQEGCLGGTGYRRLLRFEGRVGNLATSDLFLGDPNQNPSFIFVPGHGHHHFPGFVDYSVLDAAAGSTVATGHQELWTPFDIDMFVSAPWVRSGPFYFLSNLDANLGLQRGWSSVKFIFEPCQWIDVTEVPDGDYRLKVSVNTQGLFPEATLANNSSEVNVTVSDPPGAIPPVPDGYRVPGNPVSIVPFEIQTLLGETEIVQWDTTLCRAGGYNLYYSFSLPQLYRYDGALCDIGVTGHAFVSLPEPPVGGLLWFNIVGHEGTVDGGHGYDSAGRERPLTSGNRCGITATLPARGCVP